jgi:esterase/lipase superfamily enzyme
MPSFEIHDGEAATLTLSATGCESLLLTVRGVGAMDSTTLLTVMQRADGDRLTAQGQFTFAQLQLYRDIEIDPVLYGREGAAYTLDVAMKNASEAEPTILERIGGTLMPSRVSSEPEVTGADAPLLYIELAVRGRDDKEEEDVWEDSPPAALSPSRSRGWLSGLVENIIGLDRLMYLEAPARSSASPMAVEKAKSYSVWYGTDRTPVMKKGKLTDYSALRDTTVHYGRCHVSIPKSHKIGEIGSGLWKRLRTMTDDRLKLVDVLALQREAFWSDVTATLKAADIGSRHIVVFLHGYNVSFAEAAIRAAQIGCDLSIEGAMAFYSWPSRGRVDGYCADEATVQYSAAHITKFLEDVAACSGAEKVHVIAHSMGNRAAFEAMRTLVARAEERTRVPFSQFILAAPDLDAGYFLQFAEAYRKIAARTTMYVSDRDHAVRASRFLHGGVPRVGLAPPIQVVNGIDTVFAGKVDESMLGHGYVAGAWQLLNDMHQMIHLDAEPTKRAWVKRAQSNDHWVLEGVV